jgi:beta-lactamase class A
MKFLFVFSALTLWVCLAPVFLFGQKKPVTASQIKKAAAPKNSPVVFENSAALQSLVNRAAVETLSKFADKGFKSDDLAVTLIDLRAPERPKLAHFNGESKIYPASVVKMFYLAAAHRWMEDGKLKDSPEIRRAMKDMIVDSSNDATGFIVDVLTGTSNGAEISGKELQAYGEKREAINRYLKSLEYNNINVNQKTYCEDLYGRERQFWNAGKNRNMLTTNATARLMTEIALGKMVSPERSLEMMELMKRDYAGESKDPDDQAHGFTGFALQQINGAKLWSKAGWTSTTRHDAAYVETPEGLRFVLVVYTQKQAKERDIIPGIAEIVLKNLGEIK